jgi:hypothetical protein
MLYAFSKAYFSGLLKLSLPQPELNRAKLQWPCYFLNHVEYFFSPHSHTTIDQPGREGNALL